MKVELPIKGSPTSDADHIPFAAAFLICHLILGIFATSAAHSQATSSGLNLHLEMSLVENTTDSIHTRVGLKNETTSPITLTANWTYEHESGDYRQYFNSAVGFSTEPPTYIMTAQSAGSRRISDQPQHVLNPGETMSVEWIERCGRIKPSETTICTAPRLFEPGRYTVQASYTVSPGTEPLKSNPVTLDFGKTSTPPVRTSVRVLKVDTATSTALLDAGSDHGLKVGQVFMMPTSTVSGFSFNLTSVESKVSTAKFDQHLPGTWTAEFAAPQIGRLAWRKDTMESVTCDRDSKASPAKYFSTGLYLISASFLLFIVLWTLKLKKYTRSTAPEHLP